MWLAPETYLRSMLQCVPGAPGERLLVLYLPLCLLGRALVVVFLLQVLFTSTTFHRGVKSVLEGQLSTWGDFAEHDAARINKGLKSLSKLLEELL